MSHTDIMRRVIALSRQGVKEGHGGPFGCVITRNGVVVAEAHNEVLSSKDPTAHAETLAIRRASAQLGTYDLSDCEMFTNGAPCCMCMSASLWAKIGRIYYILPLEDSAAIGLGDAHLYEELARPLQNRQIVPVEQEDELSDEARAVYRWWFDQPDRQDF